jgi:Fe-S cluster assembly protein SufD
VINLDTRQNHWAEQTYSNLLYKSVASKDGCSIWHGMIYVDPDARKTDAYQSNKNLVLDDSADVKSIPGLEIHNDDVKCSHGATMGNIDAEEMYYLQARGIPPKEAELLIVEGFCNQVIQQFALETSREELRDEILKRMRL